MSVDVESILRTVDHPMPAFPAKVITLATGEPMVIREAGREEIPDILPHVEALIHHDRDFYDVVSARVYSELLAHYKHRYQDQYLLVCQCDGHLPRSSTAVRSTPTMACRCTRSGSDAA